MSAKDFMTKANGDLDIKRGDFVVDLSDEMHIDDILRSTPGTWKQAPVIGVGIRSELENDYTKRTLDDLEKRIKLHLNMDGYRIADVVLKLTGESITGLAIDAER